MGSVSTAEVKTPGFWASVWEAVRGTEQDFTEGPLGRAILLLSIPMVLEMSMESLFAVVDVFFVAKLGAEAAATVGLTEAMMAVVYGIAMGLSMATTAMIARRIGEKKPGEAADAAVQAIILGFLSAALIAGGGTFFARELLGLMGADEKVIEVGWSYTAIIFAGTFIVGAIFFCILRHKDFWNLSPLRDDL